MEKTNIREVQQVLPPPPAHMVGNGFRVHNFFPHGYAMQPDRMDPFFLMDYNAKMEFAPADDPRGVGVHPHRGFETVTIAYHGKVAHHDSEGNAGIIGPGDVQWMTAASGVLHKEYHAEDFSREGGLFQLVQLWVNLPARAKMDPPKYQALPQERIPRFSLPDGKGTVEVIAGSFRGVKGAATTYTPIELYTLRLAEGGGLDLSLPHSFNTGLLVVEGTVKVNDMETAGTDCFVLFRNNGTDFTVQAETATVVLLLAGEPIREPIVSYGPFVMNTQEEIRQAYQDLRSGKFGVLEE